MSSLDRRSRETSGGSRESARSQASPGKQTLTQNLPVQQKPSAGASASTDGVHESAARGTASAAQALPHGDAIQASFGPAFDVSSIRAHVGGDAAEACDDMCASAFASGNHVAFQRSPDLHTAAHEAAHVVQQAQGVNLYGGVGEAGDEHERHADAVADRVVAGRSAADLFGVRSTTGAPSPRAAVQRKDKEKKEKEEVDEVLDPLVRGEKLNAGQGIDLGYSYGFTDAGMDAAFKKLLLHWGIPLYPDIGDGQGARDSNGKEMDKPKDKAKGAVGGDSEGKGVAKLPWWFNPMQNKLIGSAKWGREEKATQALLDAFLRANYPDAPASIKVFFHHVGKSETNKASDELVPGSTKSDIWCAAASSAPLLKAMNDAGYRFKARIAPRDMSWAGVKKGDNISAFRQADLYQLWAGDNPGKDGAARVIGLPAASTAPLEPGDIISLVSMGTPSSGHVATVVKFNDPTITMVSGNAGGAAASQGAIRIEDTNREPMPAGAHWDQSGQSKQLGKTNPSKQGVVWIVSIQKTSQLDPKVLATMPEEALTRWGIEKVPVTA
jgi:Domain of unknown function (DUF4157)